MSPLISARRAAEDFARVVDGTRTDEAGQFVDLTATVDLLRAQEIPEARAEFVADLRSRLMVAAETLLSPTAAPAQTERPSETNVVTLSPTARRHNRRLAVAAAAFVVVGGTAGVAAAAENALPGDALYPIKRGLESAQVSFKTSDAAKGQDLIKQAGTRLDEIDGLMGSGDSSTRIAHTLSSYEHSATSGADLLFVSYQRDGDVGDLSALRGAFTDQMAQLKQLAAQAPASAQPDFASALALLADLDQQARVLCGNCGPDSGPVDFTDLTSAPALTSLLTQPVAAAAADAAKSQAEALANKANEIAKNTKPSPTTTQTPSTRDEGGLPGVDVPSVPSATGGLSTTVNTVTGGVKDLLDGVGSSTGGVLTPVTDTVDQTIDTLTNLLLGK
jgi:hypothetical protein